MEPKIKSQVYFCLWNYDEHKNWCGRIYQGKLVRKIEAKYETKKHGLFRKKEVSNCIKPEGYTVEIAGALYSLPMVWRTKQDLINSF